MTKKIVEKRRFPRHEVYTPAQLEMFDDSFPVSVEEVSIVGLKIRSSRSIAPETYFAIRINVGRDIVFHCQIVWIANILTGNKEDMYKMGLQIDAILDRGNEIIDIAEREILIQDLIVIIKRV